MEIRRPLATPREVKMKKGFVVLVALLLMILSAETADAQTNTQEKPVQNQEQAQDRPLKITKKPFASAGNCSSGSGKILMRVTFDKSEKVTDVEVINSSGCASFDENAVKAARKIKFKAAIRNGEPVTTTRLVEYNYRK